MEYSVFTRGDINNQLILHKHRLKPRTHYVSYRDEREALKMNREMSSSFYLLNGKWKFVYTEHPILAPKDFLKRILIQAAWIKSRYRDYGSSRDMENLIIQTYIILFL